MMRKFCLVNLILALCPAVAMAQQNPSSDSQGIDLARAAKGYIRHLRSEDGDSDEVSTVDVGQDASELFRGQGEGDVLLGGIAFRGQTINPSDTQYGSPYLRPIYASQLFEIAHAPKLADYARARGLDPAAPATHDQFVSEVNEQLNQYFALESVAAILDNDALMKKQSFAVQPERLEFALRKILFLDNAQLNDTLYEDFIGKKIEQALKDGSDAVKKLETIGVSPELVELFQQKLPNDKDPRDVIAQARLAFDRAAAAGLVADLTPAMQARQKDLVSPSLDPEELFERLRAKVGSDPYFFSVAWNEALNASFTDLASKFTDNWQPVLITGQNPAYGANDVFPDSLESFRAYLEKKLLPRQRALIRQKVANTWLLQSWRNADILNPNAPKNPSHLSNMFNPMSSLLLTIGSTDLDQAYGELKYELAAHNSPDFTIVEVKLGESHDISTGALDPCVSKFNAAFEKPYTEEQQAQLAKLSDRNLTTAGYDALILQAREQIPLDAYQAGAAALKADAACAGFASQVETKTVSIQPGAKELAGDELARVRFVAQVMSQKQLQRMIIPKMSRRDEFGNVHHYFFVRHRMLYLPRTGDAASISAELRQAIRTELCTSSIQTTGKGCDDPTTAAGIDSSLESRIDMMIREVNASLRDQVVQRRLADRMAEVVAKNIMTRYAIQANFEKFSYDGVDGFQLKSALADPIEHRAGPNDYRAGWIEQMFIVPREQVNPELLQERRLIEKSSKVFEKTNDLP